MKKALLVMLLLAAFGATKTFSQNTYYWVGGAGPSSWATAANWNTTLGGGGTNRTTPNSGDVLIFDGTNIGAGATGAVTVNAIVAETEAQLKFINNANVTLGSSSTRTITIGGGTGDDFVIGSGSTVTFGYTSNTSAITILFNSGTTGNIAGTFTLQLGSHKITPAAAANCITFTGTSTLNHNVTSGNVFGTTAVATNNNVVFQSGSNLAYGGGGSPFGATAPASVCEFQDGSTFTVNTTSAISLSNRPYANLVINANQTASGAPIKLGSLTVNNGTTLTLNTASNFPIMGDITLNGTGSIATTTNFPKLVFCGTSPQSVTVGSGSIGSLSNINVSAEADVTLNTNLVLAPATAQNSNISGKLTLGTSTITGNANATFRAVAASSTGSITGDLTLGSQVITNVSNTAGFNSATTVSGTGIPAGAVVLSVSGSSVTISRPPTVTSTGVALTVYNIAPTITTSNTGGLIGALPSMGTYVWNSGANYVFNAATTTPFQASLSANNITTNADVTLNNDVTVTGTLTVANPLTIAAGKTLAVSGTAAFGGNNVTFKSDNTGTANGIFTGTVTGSSNVTTERYVPAKAARKWSFLAAPIAGITVRNGWQQQIFVTGSGTGGAAPCTGTTNGNGGGTDKYNSNGFDVSVANAPTIYKYDGSQTAGSRWVAITHTPATLAPGFGYRVNVRGTRGASDANCSNLLNNATPPAPDAVTLSTTGPLVNGMNYGDVVVFGGGNIGEMVLLGNPYPSSIDFDVFSTANTDITAGKYWFYSPENTAAGINSTAYSAYTTGSMTNKPTGYTDANAKNIASGQSFFVEKATTGPSVTFKESQKIAAQSGSFRTQSYNWTNVIRAGLKSADGLTHMDEVLIRFGNVNGVSKSYTQAWDAASLNEGNNLIVSFKDANKLAIQTRPLNFSDDTVKLGVTINNTGNYRLSFSEYETFTSALVIKLRDKFLGTEQDIKSNPVYTFSATNDANSKGDNRFEIVFKGSGALPVSYIGITAKNKGSNDVEVSWQLPSETDVRNYEVQRSADSRTFETRGTINSRGNSLSMQTYTFTDAQRLSGTSYYRVKATDKSGTINYSPIVKVSNGKEQLAASIYPNPVKDNLNILLQNVEGSYTIKVNAVNGKSMLVQNGNTITGNIVSIGTANLAAGIYMVEITDSKGNRAIEKMVKQ